MKYRLVISAFLLLISFGVVTAVEYPNPLGDVKTIGGILGRVIDFAENVARSLAVIAVLWAAFMYVTAGGSEDKISQAHRALTYGVIGLAIVLSGRFLRDVLAGAAEGAVGQTFAGFVDDIAFTFGIFIIAASVIAILYSAFLFLTSGGDSDKVTTARQALLYAVIGVAVAVVAFALPGLVDQIVP